ncbi:fimbrillin family protein [Parasphaerochaeta coccoides]|uniref:Fimbrillin family protein n=1 Tax=Parasphaerochaeta coccoides (strain ATCC BAA-1237 / DSM 17374 / SPN1) TaxID=760011 RepID=F4GIZ0_PARC1|nr:fimbrillin family protein [Parasphaerochaeta coccoides]AEC01285.1 hypothetical protein Spico_0043 [Parasphaerochaeta coccoides DSM 17374]
MRENKLSIVVSTGILMLIVAFVSCDSNTVPVSNSHEVRFTSNIARKAMADSVWQANDEVGIFMLEHGTGTAATAQAVGRGNKHYKADTASQSSGFTPFDAANTLKWDDLGMNPAPFFDFIAYYPYVTNTNDMPELEIKITDSSTEQDTGKADFLWGRTNNVQNNTSQVALKLKHLFSRLIVNIGPSTTVDASAINAGDLSIELSGLKTTAIINLDTGVVTPDSSNSVIMRNISDTLTTMERLAGKRRFEAVLVPTDNATALSSFVLDFFLDEDTYEWEAASVAQTDKGKIVFESGKQYVYNMTLNTAADKVAVAAIQIGIEDWVDGGSISGGAVK